MHGLSIDGLHFIQKPLGVHHVRTELFSKYLTLLHSLYKANLDTPVSEPISSFYRFVAIVSDIAFHKLFKPVCEKGIDEGKRSFLSLPFVNKGMDEIYLANILHHKKLRIKFPRISNTNQY